jgi:endogenous inhibitor of DNA gyrase (YacG/DUF329 family)
LCAAAGASIWLAMTGPRLVPCPQCGQPAPFEPANRWRPFCSQRCREIDLGAWAREDYRMPDRGRDGAAPDVPDEGQDFPH